jgi:nicotinamide riboside transporter PnuC
VNSDASTSRNIEWGPWIVLAVGGLLFLTGAARFVLKHRFGFIDALHCCLAVVPAALLLLVFEYVFHHARLVSVILLFVVGVWVFLSPVFDVALGSALMGAIAGAALSEWKSEKRLRKSTTAHGGENKERK